ncbi:acetyl-CoA-benzylalcohol acetyltransferase-like [Rhodamnia argentea]|uniref:Acetyl-CoA-benzylalcohol acetyltransferase-like n=1 Tax=Rhodamnia argentea TaxID=178133 RepID=A0A8B8PU46_9MYRT|nr:acetyl-CoA-benzylalcohol acetyltransferase-like [Rhodamnia argentea]
MKVEVQWKKLVKPTAPTPHHRQKLKLSPIDGIQVPFYVGSNFCYRDNAENRGVDTLQRLHRMEKSLSETLTLFYPMAGRYTEDDGCFIDCNDLGVEFVHAKVDGQIDQLLHGDLDMELIGRLSQFPTNVVGNPLVVIQVNTFKRGGLVVGLRFIRNIGDVCTFAMFINSWATAFQGNIDLVECPNFELYTLFSGKEPVVRYQPPPPTGNEQFVTSRFKFSSDAILKLKALARDDVKDSMANNSQPSRVEVVSALISRALIDIDRNR